MEIIMLDSKVVSRYVSEILSFDQTLEVLHLLPLQFFYLRDKPC